MLCFNTFTAFPSADDCHIVAIEMHNQFQKGSDVQRKTPSHEYLSGHTSGLKTIVHFHSQRYNDMPL